MRYKNIVTGEIVDEQILICDYNDDFKLEEPDNKNKALLNGGLYLGDTSSGQNSLARNAFHP